MNEDGAFLPEDLEELGFAEDFTAKVEFLQQKVDEMVGYMSVFEKSTLDVFHPDNKSETFLPLEDIYTFLSELRKRKYKKNLKEEYPFIYKEWKRLWPLVSGFYKIYLNFKKKNIAFGEITSYKKDFNAIINTLNVILLGIVTHLQTENLWKPQTKEVSQNIREEGEVFLESIQKQVLFLQEIVDLLNKGKDIAIDYEYFRSFAVDFISSRRNLIDLTENTLFFSTAETINNISHEYVRFVDYFSYTVLKLERWRKKREESTNFNTPKPEVNVADMMKWLKKVKKYATSMIHYAKTLLPDFETQKPAILTEKAQHMWQGFVALQEYLELAFKRGEYKSKKKEFREVVRNMKEKEFVFFESLSLFGVDEDYLSTHAVHTAFTILKNKIGLQKADASYVEAVQQKMQNFKNALALKGIEVVDDKEEVEYIFAVEDITTKLCQQILDLKKLLEVHTKTGNLHVTLEEIDSFSKDYLGLTDIVTDLISNETILEDLDSIKSLLHEYGSDLGIVFYYMRDFIRGSDFNVTAVNSALENLEKYVVSILFYLKKILPDFETQKPAILTEKAQQMWLGYVALQEYFDKAITTPELLQNNDEYYAAMGQIRESKTEFISLLGLLGLNIEDFPLHSLENTFGGQSLQQIQVKMNEFKAVLLQSGMVVFDVLPEVQDSVQRFWSVLVQICKYVESHLNLFDTPDVEQEFRELLSQYRYKLNLFFKQLNKLEHDASSLSTMLSHLFSPHEIFWQGRRDQDVLFDLQKGKEIIRNVLISKGFVLQDDVIFENNAEQKEDMKYKVLPPIYPKGVPEGGKEKGRVRLRSIAEKIGFIVPDSLEFSLDVAEIEAVIRIINIVMKDRKVMLHSNSVAEGELARMPGIYETKMVDLRDAVHTEMVLRESIYDIQRSFYTDKARKERQRYNITDDKLLLMVDEFRQGKYYGTIHTAKGNDTEIIEITFGPEHNNVNEPEKESFVAHFLKKPDGNVNLVFYTENFGKIPPYFLLDVAEKCFAVEQEYGYSDIEFMIDDVDRLVLFQHDFLPEVENEVEDFVFPTIAEEAILKESPLCKGLGEFILPVVKIQGLNVLLEEKRAEYLQERDDKAGKVNEGVLNVLLDEVVYDWIKNVKDLDTQYNNGYMLFCDSFNESIFEANSRVKKLANGQTFHLLTSNKQFLVTAKELSPGSHAINLAYDENVPYIGFFDEDVWQYVKTGDVLTAFLGKRKGVLMKK